MAREGPGPELEHNPDPGPDPEQVLEPVQGEELEIELGGKKQQKLATKLQKFEK